MWQFSFVIKVNTHSSRYGSTYKGLSLSAMSTSPASKGILARRISQSPETKKKSIIFFSLPWDMTAFSAVRVSRWNDLSNFKRIPGYHKAVLEIDRHKSVAHYDPILTSSISMSSSSPSSPESESLSTWPASAMASSFLMSRLAAYSGLSTYCMAKSPLRMRVAMFSSDFLMKSSG